ncbi:unnamed protein product [Soboliphyme baturini]|uniref:SUEL-type lectin domain-containing protein n=1 Tax=Soboliphyme baturini TaxID=241478 RepID=A0A3P8FQ84_9BILA|nr:unnamed protein product [Soboliphyme baturini]
MWFPDSIFQFIAQLYDSLNIYVNGSCEGSKVFLKCPKYTQILIERAFYGQNVSMNQVCSSAANDFAQPAEIKLSKNMDVQQERFLESMDGVVCEISNAQTKVVESCQNKRKCKINVNARFFGRDPCPSTSKYFQVFYRCKPSQFISEHLCEGDRLNLSCPSGQRLSFYSSSYGILKLKDSSTLCGETQGLSQADCSVDVLPEILRRCQAQPVCSFVISDSVFSHTCGSQVVKQLIVIFICADDVIFTEKALRGEAYSNGMNDPVAPLVVTAFSIIGEAFGPTEFSYAHRKHVLSDGSNGSVMVVTPPLSMPSSMPNAIGFVQNWITTWTYITENKEKFVLYFFLSASVGVIMLLVMCIAQQCFRHNHKALCDAGTSHDATTIANYVPSQSESRIELDDLEQGGISFMRFNHPTPPLSARTVHHYYS